MAELKEELEEKEGGLAEYLKRVGEVEAKSRELVRDLDSLSGLEEEEVSQAIGKVSDLRDLLKQSCLDSLRTRRRLKLLQKEMFILTESLTRSEEHFLQTAGDALQPEDLEFIEEDEEHKNDSVSCKEVPDSESFHTNKPELETVVETFEKSKGDPKDTDRSDKKTKNVPAYDEKLVKGTSRPTGKAVNKVNKNILSNKEEPKSFKDDSLPCLHITIKEDYHQQSDKTTSNRNKRETQNGHQIIFQTSQQLEESTIETESPSLKKHQKNTPVCHNVSFRQSSQSEVSQIHSDDEIVLLEIKTSEIGSRNFDSLGDKKTECGKRNASVSGLVLECSLDGSSDNSKSVVEEGENDLSLHAIDDNKEDTKTDILQVHRAMNVKIKNDASAPSNKDYEFGGNYNPAVSLDKLYLASAQSLKSENIGTDTVSIDDTIYENASSASRKDTDEAPFQLISPFKRRINRRPRFQRQRPTVTDQQEVEKNQRTTTNRRRQVCQTKQARPLTPDLKTSEITHQDQGTSNLFPMKTVAVQPAHVSKDPDVHRAVTPIHQRLRPEDKPSRKPSGRGLQSGVIRKSFRSQYLVIPGKTYSDAAKASKPKTVRQADERHEDPLAILKTLNSKTEKHKITSRSDLSELFQNVSEIISNFFSKCLQHSF